ncbi:MAG: hypothetical protein AB7S93_02480 [Xanthobacteraceae bacterium]
MQAGLAERRVERRQQCEAEQSREIFDRRHRRGRSGTKQQNLAGKRPGNECLQHLGGLKSCRRQIKDNEIGRPRLDRLVQLFNLLAFAGDESEALQRLREKCSDVLLVSGDADAKSDISPPERDKIG